MKCNPRIRGLSIVGPRRITVSPHSVLAIERTFVAFASGVLALMLYVGLVGVVADWPLSTLDRNLLEYLGPWLMSLHAGVLGLLFVGIPIGLACGYLCGKLPPYYSLSAAAVLILPFLYRDPGNLSLYTPSTMVALGHTASCAIGSYLRLCQGSIPSFSRAAASEKTASHVLCLDIVLLSIFVPLILVGYSWISQAGSARQVPATSFTIGSVVFAVVFVLRSRVRVKAVTSAA